VFWNLLRNSIKFSPPRSSIAILARVVPADRCPLASRPCSVGMGDCPLPPADGGDGQPRGENLIVEVIDHGSGIAPDMLPRLFNAFEQEQKARSFGGLGLGLSICKAVVEVHGGAISAHSDGSGKGATFTARLPIAQCPLAAARDGSPMDADEAQATGGDGKPASPPLKAIRILLVEDHADTAKLMSRLLMADGHEVTVADSVASALGAVEQAAGKLDLLISDLGLPDGSGHDLMRQLVAQGTAIPGIALSGYGAAADIDKSKAAGFAEHLVKPINPDLIASAIRRVTAYRQRERISSQT
jgi:two-component system, chemotaxis family, CheB/CheR fusion protein